MVDEGFVVVEPDEVKTKVGSHFFRRPEGGRYLEHRADGRRVRATSLASGGIAANPVSDSPPTNWSYRR